MQDLHKLLQKYELLHEKSDILNAAKQSIKIIKNKVQEEQISLGPQSLVVYRICRKIGSFRNTRMVIILF
jgi:hypothetical protein